jgi:hypothetical protein
LLRHIATMESVSLYGLMFTAVLQLERAILSAYCLNKF